MNSGSNKINKQYKINEKEFNKIFDSVSLGFALCELVFDRDENPIDYRFLRINPAFGKQIELKVSSVIGKTAKEIYPDIEQSGIDRYANVVMLNSPIQFIEYNQNTSKTFSVNVYLFSENKFVMLFEDITPQTNSEHKLRKSEKLYEQLFNSMDEMFKIIELIYDEDGNAIDYYYLQVNRAFEALVNKKKNELIGRRAKEVFAVVEDHWIKTYERIEKTGKPENYENYGEELNKHYSINAWKVDKGKVAVVFTDVTEHKLAEKAIIENHRLNAISDMATSIAHDFNNSLHNIMGSLDLVKLRNDLPSSVLARLTNIESTITDMAGRVKALQHFGDIKSENKKNERISFNETIAESLKQSRPLWKDKMEKEGLIVKVVNNYGEIPKIDCNARELELVINNLIKNSIEAMPQGGDISIKTGVKTEGVFMTFSDSGIGMNEETKLKIFQPFYTTKGFDSGRGLGMSGVYSIVKKYEGDISVVFSELGKGTTIEIVFPIGKNEAINETEENTGNEKLILRVLWVDDDQIIRENGCEMLELLGHQCDTANNGKVALNYLSNHEFDIVITDIAMPEMNGWQLADAIRENFGDEIKIVVVSGWGIDETEKNKHGVNDVLQKPFKMEQISEIIKR